MNHFSAASLAVGLIVGALAGYGLRHMQQLPAASKPNSASLQQDSKNVRGLHQQLATARDEITALRAQLATQAEAEANATSGFVAEAAVNAGLQSESPTLDVEPTSEALLTPQESLFEQAMAALLAGDQQEASRLFNQLRLTANSQEQKNQAVEGLLAIQEQNYNELRSTVGQTNAALWSLFEMHKLQPDEQTRIELVGVSVQAYKEAQQYLTEDNLLASADHLSSLMHLSRMMEYKVPVQGSDSLDSSDFAEELQEIQGDPAYVPRLAVRAENNLYNGDDQQKSQVFWDYTQLASLQGPDTINQPAFRTQFVQATLEHLTHLKNSNQAGELQSRMNYIRYAFPQIMNDPLISSFQ